MQQKIKQELESDKEEEETQGKPHQELEAETQRHCRRSTQPRYCVTPCSWSPLAKEESESRTWRQVTASEPVTVHGCSSQRSSLLSAVGDTLPPFFFFFLLKRRNNKTKTRAQRWRKRGFCRLGEDPVLGAER